MILRIWSRFACACGIGEAGSVEVEQYFRPISKDSRLKSRAVRGGASTLLAQVVGLGVQLGSTIVLARLLTPRDVGLVTMVLTFSMLLQNFGTNGFTEAIIQSESLTHENLSTLFWINVAGGFGLTVAFMIVAPFLAAFYHEPELKGICLALAASIAITSLGAQHLALLKRNLEFSVVNVNSVGARALSVLTAIAMAWLGFGYWALVANVVIPPFLMGLGAWFCCAWRPGWPARQTNVRPMLKFTLNTFGWFSTNYAGRNLDKLLLGRFAGSAVLGNYKRAYDLFCMPADVALLPMTTVALSTLSRLRQEPERYRQYYLTAISLIAFVGMGGSALLTLIGRDLIHILLGSKWDEAGRIIVYFAPALGVTWLYWTYGWLHMSLGHADRWFRWGIIEMLVTCGFVAIGLPFGSRGVAIAWVVSFCVLIGPGLSYAGRPIGITFIAILSVVWRYASSALAAGLLSWYVLYGIGPIAAVFASLNVFTRAAMTGFGCVILYSCLLLLFPFSKTFAPVLEVATMLSPPWIALFLRKSTAKGI